jgi:L-threonylcarbamoyladenylate synthase
MQEIINGAKNAFGQKKLVALPTETVYGLAAPINQSDLVEKIFTLKKRPANHPLISHVDSVSMAKKYCENWNYLAETLTQKFWPGPLTLLLKKNSAMPDNVTGGSQWCGLRMPRHPLALELISAMQVPLCAPSANLHKKTSATKAAHVRGDFSADEVFVMDGGDCEIGLESTIVKVHENNIEILRPGSISLLDIQECFKNSPVMIQNSFKPGTEAAPGQMAQHYRPEKPLVVVFNKSQLNDAEKNNIKKLLGLRFDQLLELKLPLVFSDVAKNLYDTLRAPVEKSGSIYFFPDELKKDHRADVLIDRLSKAASLWI